MADASQMARRFNNMLPGFAQIGFGEHLHAVLTGLNQAIVQANFPALLAKLAADGVVLTVTATQTPLVEAWNALCDALTAYGPPITIPDYDNCKVLDPIDFGVKLGQMAVALDREAGLSGTYAAAFVGLTVPHLYQ